MARIVCSVLIVSAACVAGTRLCAAAAEGTAAEAPRPDVQLRTTVLDVLKADAQLTTFVRALETTGMDETLRGTGPYTVFAPTNDAFDRLNNRDALMQTPELLKMIIKHHIVPFGRTQSKDLSQLKIAGTLEAQDLHFRADPQPMVDDAAIVSADLNADNGVVHAIGRVLMPKIDAKLLETARATRQEPEAAPAVAAAPQAPVTTTAITAAPTPTTGTTTNATTTTDTAPAPTVVVVTEKSEQPTVVSTTYNRDDSAGDAMDPMFDVARSSADTMYRNFKHAGNKFKKFFTGGHDNRDGRD
jgi:uncharacterized surface protein with fasciclin (FAS1) repeats